MSGNVHQATRAHYSDIACAKNYKASSNEKTVGAGIELRNSSQWCHSSNHLRHNLLNILVDILRWPNSLSLSLFRSLEKAWKSTKIESSMKSVFVFHFEKSIICWKSSFLQNRKKASFLFKTSKQYSHHFLFCSNRHEKVELKFYSTSRQIKFAAHSRTWDVILKIAFNIANLFDTSS